jgi:predicted acetyltransferase
MTLLFEPLADHEGQLEGAVRAVALSFGQGVDGTRAWLRNEAGLENMRVAGRVGGPFDPSHGAARRAEGVLFRVPMGQWFGGRVVSNAGYAGVVVSPEARGFGLARGMMTAALHEARRDGFALASLNASTLTLYRKVGFELAGHCFETTVPLLLDRPFRAPGAKRELEVVALPREVTPSLRACRDAFARVQDGMLDRGPYCWGRVFVFRGTTMDGFGLVDAAGNLEAYAFVSIQYQPGTLYVAKLVVNDLAWSTPRGARELLGFLSDYAPVTRTMAFKGGPTHPLLALLPQHEGTVERVDHWLLRLVDVERALVQRGYRKHVRAAATVAIADDTLPENAGVYTLAVEGGAATVTRSPGASPGARLDVRALAPLYAGLRSAEEARLLGELDGDDATCAALTSIFSGGTPAMNDFY